jgi:hypothetical protein
MTASAMRFEHGSRLDRHVVGGLGNAVGSENQEEEEARHDPAERFPAPVRWLIERYEHLLPRSGTVLSGGTITAGRRRAYGGHATGVPLAGFAGTASIAGQDADAPSRRAEAMA